MIRIWSAALKFDRTGRSQSVFSSFNSMLMQTLNADPSLLDISDSNTVLCQSFLSLKSQKTTLRYCLLFTPTHTHTFLSLHALSVSHIQPTVSSIFENKSLQPKSVRKTEQQRERGREGGREGGGSTKTGSVGVKEGYIFTRLIYNCVYEFRRNQLVQRITLMAFWDCNCVFLGEYVLFLNQRSGMSFCNGLLFILFACVVLYQTICYSFMFSSLLYHYNSLQNVRQYQMCFPSTIGAIKALLYEN